MHKLVSEKILIFIIVKQKLNCGKSVPLTKALE